MPELSRSQVDRLGRRLRRAEVPSVEDLRLLEQVRRTYEDARLEVVATLLSAGLEGTSRLKTTSTIIDKLRRETTMGLSRMQDIAGVRLVIEGTRLDQDRVVEHIGGPFDETTTLDRRERPSYGYRAVHVIVRSQGCLVEIQVRTPMQDQWAQIVERLADVLGRQIRYGEPPTNPDAEVAPGTTRRQLVEMLMSVSSRIDAIEDVTAGLQEPVFDLAGNRVDPGSVPWLSELRTQYGEAERELRASLNRLHAALGD
jgi:hypothetical protein